MPVTLDQIVAATRKRVAERKRVTGVAALRREAARHQPRGFRGALAAAAQERVAIIAELKKASPSKGLLRETFRPGAIAYEYAQAGATALSVLTEEEFFLGSLVNLREASAACGLPCLRKDFIVDEFQLVEARANCADAILLLASVLSDQELQVLQERAWELELDVLCEVHDETELQRAIDAGCDIIGVNSRDLRTFAVDLNTALTLGPQIPTGVLKVAESGISSGRDIARLRRAGFDAFLIGESLIRQQDPGKALCILLAEAVNEAVVGL
ncbi:MAG: indole-3-glycerol phosphate synthase TrpC [Terriglobales bacterium]